MLFEWFDGAGDLIHVLNSSAVVWNIAFGSLTFPEYCLQPFYVEVVVGLFGVVVVMFVVFVF